LNAVTYLAHLRRLAIAYAHSEPIPSANRNLYETVQETLGAKALEPTNKASREAALVGFNLTYPSLSMPPAILDWNVCDLRLEILQAEARVIRKYLNRANRGARGFPHLGVLPIGTVDAVALRVPGSSSNLIVFNSGVFDVLYVLSKIAVVTSTRQVDPPVVNGQVRMRIPGICRTKCKELFSSYFLYGRPDRTDQWLLDDYMLPALNNVVRSSERFLLAHEVAHVLNGHVTSHDSELSLLNANVAVDLIDKTITQEREADLTGAIIVLECADEHDKMVALAGVEISIAARRIIDNSYQIFAGEEVDANSVYENPRILALHRSLKEYYGHRYKRWTEFARDVCVIYDSLWQDVRSLIVKYRDSGKIIAKVWQPV
jgi:hypothetical protein